ncbi:hypothetical protein BVC93_17285 [Mycobacterium sp. MS1601]|uniref:DUF4383 domain-containing protein n=1 Tax=Mycobacterium sp. MS1601 TaxID=1936029 RepID=UPI00097966AE|nr:DUF4383 domain-containing protein [Mycobacterium sp. MS1601]AQA03891.1 hypothetical protein BVC93_17285 [Mycobacterium sp. MS1601]
MSTRVRRRPQVGLLAVQCASILVGALLLIVGVLGFVPGISSHVDGLRLAGPESATQLFGIFQTSILHNLIHVAVGVAGLVLATTYARSRAYLLAGGLLFLGFWVHGLTIDLSGPANVLPVDTADNWLNLGLGATMVIMALTLAGTRVPTGAGGEVLIPE